MPVGKRIKHFREKLELNQGELATRAGIKQALLSHYENGRRTPDWPRLNQISAVLNCQPSDLTGGLTRQEYEEKHLGRPTLKGVTRRITSSSLPPYKTTLYYEVIIEIMRSACDMSEITPETLQRTIDALYAIEIAKKDALEVAGLDYEMNIDPIILQGLLCPPE